MDDETFVAFYSRHYRLILTVAHQRLGGFGDAEDVTAEVFRIAWAHHGAGNELTLAWVYATLRNVVGHEYRRRSRVTALVGRLGPMQDPASVPVPVDDQLAVHAAMEALAEPDRDVLRMAYWEDLAGDRADPWLHAHRRADPPDPGAWAPQEATAHRRPGWEVKRHGRPVC